MPTTPDSYGYPGDQPDEFVNSPSQNMQVFADSMSLIGAYKPLSDRLKTLSAMMMDKKGELSVNRSP